MAFNKILQIIDWFIPEIWKVPGVNGFGGETAERLRKARLLIGFSIFCVPLVFAMFVLRFIAEGGHSSPTIIALPIIGSILLCNFIWVKVFHKLQLGVYLVLTVTLFIIPFRTIHTGGMNSTVLLWFCAVPVWASMMISTRASLISAVIILGEMILIAFPDIIGLRIEPVPLIPLAQVVVAATAMFTCTTLVVVYENQRKRYQSELVTQSEALEQEKAQTEYLNQLLSTMLDSVGQGFLIFDLNGSCYPTYSKACETLLDGSPAGKKIWEVLNISEKELSTFRLWLDLLAQGNHEFSNLSSLGPQEKVSLQGRNIRFEYFPVYSHDRLDAIVMVTTDVTEEIKAKEQALADRSHASMIIKMARNSHAFVRFNKSLEEMLMQFESSLSAGPGQRTHLARIMHTIKGTASTLSMMELAGLANKLESLVHIHGSSTDPNPQLTREKINEHLKLIKNCHRSTMKEFEAVSGRDYAQSGRHIRRISDDKIRHFLTQLNDHDVNAQLRDEFLKTFIMEPAARFFILYDELLQNLSQQLFKKVKPLEIKNGDLLIDPDPYHALFETFVHIFRNAMDHGIELPSKRQHTGKDPEGLISVNFERFEQGGSKWLRIEIEDDGGGIDVAKIRKRFVENGRVNEITGMNDDQILQLIFSPNFSTADQVTEISGRGVGLDAVMAEAKKLGGTARVETNLGRGSKFIIEVPDVLSTSA